MKILRVKKSARLFRSLLISLSLASLSAFSSLALAGFFGSGSTGFGSASSDGFLPVEQAFQLEGTLKGSTLTLKWEIEPGHYLYRSRFQVKSLEPEGVALLPISIPNGEKVDDEFQGRVEILRNRVKLEYRFETPAEALKQGTVVDVVFQGCAEAGLCYPPHRQRLNLIQK